MVIAALFCTYLIGSLPFAVIAGYIMAATDIRSKGSGNAGANNVRRVLGWKPAIAVLLLDFTKAFAPVFWLPQLAYISGHLNWKKELFQLGLLLCVVLGHAFPIWARFKGGKGVATAAGGVAAIFWPAIPFGLFVFITTVALTRIVSLASLLTVWLLPLYYVLFVTISSKYLSLHLLIFFLLLAGLITFFHRANIYRILNRKEPKIGSGS